MNNWIRQLWFRHYWWLTLVFLGVAVLVVVVSGTREVFGIAATFAGAAATIVYFVQKQKLEEFTLFERLFTQFNKRYGDLNDKLQDIVAKKASWEPESHNTLNAYFNLCAEEYLFYSQGRIHPSAWKAWCRGMLHYLGNERIRHYYGMRR